MVGRVSQVPGATQKNWTDLPAARANATLTASALILSPAGMLGPLPGEASLARRSWKDIHRIGSGVFDDIFESRARAGQYRRVGRGRNRDESRVTVGDRRGGELTAASECDHSILV